MPGDVHWIISGTARAFFRLKKANPVAGGMSRMYDMPIGNPGSRL